MQLPNVVSVLESSDKDTMAISQIVSLSDDSEGNSEANDLFRTLVRENEDSEVKLTDDELEDCLDDGYYEHGSGYYVCIVHSTPIRTMTQAEAEALSPTASKPTAKIPVKKLPTPAVKA